MAVLPEDIDAVVRHEARFPISMSPKNDTKRVPGMSTCILNGSDRACSYGDLALSKEASQKEAHRLFRGQSQLTRGFFTA